MNITIGHALEGYLVHMNRAFVIDQFPHIWVRQIPIHSISELGCIE